MKNLTSLARSKIVPKQSDIVIKPDGEISISFLWDDLFCLSNDLVQSERPTAINDLSLMNVALPSYTATLFPLDEYAKCKLCPKVCGFDRTKANHPRCNDYRLRVSTAGLTMGDEPMIRGDRGSGAIMMSGCPLQCPSCHNPEMVSTGVELSIDELVSLVWSLRDQGAHNIQILSPTVHLPAIREALKILKSLSFNLPIILKSSGYESILELKKLEGLVDIYLPDLKFGSSSCWAKLARAVNYFEICKEVIFEMYRQVGDVQFDKNGVLVKGVLVRHVLAPLPEIERSQILNFLTELPPTICKSVTDNFVTFDESLVAKP